MRETHQLTTMDVTFTNVLEGVRQYFQGLPAGSGEAAGDQQQAQQQPPLSEPQVAGGGAPASSPQTAGTAPNYPSAYDPPPAANPPQGTASTTSYNTYQGSNSSYTWPEREKPQGQTETHNQSTNQNYWTSDVKVHDRLQNQTQNHAQTAQDTSKLIQNYHFQQQTSNSYQYSRQQVDNQTHHSYSNVHQQTSRPTPRPQEVPTSNYQVKHGDSVYINGYPQRTSSVRSQETIASKNYQQIQKTTPTHAESMYMINGYNQNNPYYPSHTKAQTPIVAPPTSTQNYQQTPSSQYLQYSTHSQSPVQTQTQYLSAKISDYEAKTELHRRTHNLPPIAALSSVNYHSNKMSRESVPKVSAIPSRQNYVVPKTVSSVASTNTVPSTVYSSAQQQNRPSAIFTHHSRSNSFSTVQNPSGTQVRYSANTEQHYQYPVASSAYPTSINPSSNSSKTVYPQSSYTQYFQKPVKVENQTSNHLSSNQNQIINHRNVNHVKDVHRVGESSTTNIPNQHRNVMPNVLEAIKKKESPLDLSVKTVRTSADSTALDESEGTDQRFAAAFRNRLDNKYVYPNIQNPINGSYIVKENQNLAYQQNLIRSSNVPTTGAPKVDFLPNFSASALHNQTSERQQHQYSRPSEPTYSATQNNLGRTAAQEYYHRTNPQQAPVLNHQSSLRHNSVGNSTYQINQNNDNKTDSLPRFELPIEGNGYRKTSLSYPNTNDINRKRTASETQAPLVVPNKVAKVEAWRQKIDQQIEQKLLSVSSYDNAQQNNRHQIPNQFAKPATNLNQKPVYSGQYYQQAQNYRTSNLHAESHTSNQNHQYASVNHQYPPNTDQYEMYLQNSLHRSNSTSKLISPKSNTNNGGANKRTLSILRNSLEIKGAKEALKKLDQMKPNVPVNAQSGIQYPSTDVTAPLQPKPSIHSRHNVSPFTASSLERNSNTPPNYKFTFPRAVDSVKFETDTVIKDELNHNHNKIHTYPTDEVNLTGNDSTHPVGASTGSESLDGLAASLAARIRTKGERKQLTSNELLMLQRNNPELLALDKLAPDNNLSGNSSSGSPPKLNRELNATLSRRKLFNKSEEEQIPAPINGGTLMPHRSTLRSSSEASVFDFRDSDSEGEMPVLERQSLEDMRRACKSQNRTIQNNPFTDLIADIKTDEPEDPDWAEMCSKFCEQLQTNIGKKRGRRKKLVEAEDIAKLETVAIENPVETELELVIKQEIIDESDIKIEPEFLEKEIKKEIIEEQVDIHTNVDDDSDSDVPLTNIKRSIKKEKMQSDEEELITKKNEKVGAKTRIEYSSDSDSDTNTDKIDSVSRNLFNRKSKRHGKIENEKMVLRSADSSPVKNAPISYLKKKALFGDGSDFHPGWEDEVYKYKRSIRMPARLINVTKPHWHRMSTSLPDLDACSPAPSSLTDDTDFTINQRKMNHSLDVKQIKRDLFDSDSNSSFGLKNDDEASSSSLKMKKEKNSFLDVLVERVVKFKKRRNKSKETKTTPKIIEKSSNLLLATPSLGIRNEDDKEKKKGKTKVKEKQEKEEDSTKENSVYLGYFRKETVSNFRDQFKKSGGLLGEPFSAIVLKSRTRKETRVMKQRATIREVFGEDRPASAPPMTCLEEQIKEEISDPTKTKEKIKEKEKGDRELKDNKTEIRKGLRSATSPVKKTYHLKRKYTFKNTNSETNSIASVDEIVIKSETPSVNGDETDNSLVPTKKKYKLTKMRRKFSSGFDYIRKKKKVIKKEGSEDGEKPKRRGFPSRQDPECEEDIQKEIKMWVMNKGVGETHLHRAARLGYADVTAYCLEKMNSYPSPKDNAGYTPLHEACSRGHLDIARLLLVYGANVSESAQGGIRPLHEAAENGFVEIIRLLLSYGADPRLATYSGLTPLSLATDEETRYILKNYISDMEGLPAPPWIFNGPAACFDKEISGYNPLEDVPQSEPESELDSDIEMEITENPLPNLYVLKDEPPSERWILLQDLSAILKIKSRDALLKQINPGGQNTAKTLIRELKFNDFLDKAQCLTLLCAGEKINVRSSKIALVKYTDKVKKLLGVEKYTVPAR